MVDAAGRRLASSGVLAAGAGRNEVELRAGSGALRAGVYFARLRIGQQTMSRAFSVTP